MIQDSNGTYYHANPWGVWRVADRRVTEWAAQFDADGAL